LASKLRTWFPIRVRTSCLLNGTIVAIIRAETRGLGDVLLGEEETSLARLKRGWRMRAIYAASTTACHDRRISRIFWVAVFVSLARVDWDSAKSLKSTRGCRSIAGADDKWGNGQLAESFPPFTRGVSLLSRSVLSVVSLGLIPGNYKLFVISVTAPEVAARHALPRRRGGG